MGQITKGILGGFSGTVGTVVGSNWKGKDVIRSKPTVRRSRPQTEKQLVQQAKFGLVTKFLSSFNELLMESFQRPVKGMTNINESVSDVLKKSITGVYPNFTIAYDQVVLTQGKLPNVSLPVASSTTPGAINFTWQANPLFGKATGDDLSLLIAYCPEYDTVLYRKGGMRDLEADELLVPGFKGKAVHTWIAFFSADGKDIATTKYVGLVTVM